MIDLVQLQADVFGLLLSTPALNSVNIVLERKFLADASVELDTIWQTVRNGRSGCGVLVEMPRLSPVGKNSLAPQQAVRFRCVAFQNGDMAFAPLTGCGLHAETIAQLINDALHGQELKGYGTLYGDEPTVAPARDFDFINAQETVLFLRSSQTNQTQRCAPVTITNNSLTVTLACATSGAEIFYTLDGSAPVSADAKDPVTEATINPQSQLYSAPFVVPGGARLRAVAFAPGYNASQVNQETIN